MASKGFVGIASSVADIKSRLLRVSFKDGSNGVYSFAWLRDNAPDPSTMELTDRCRSRKMLLNDLDTKIVPSESSVTESGEAISIRWPDLSHSVSYSCKWLRDRNLHNENLRRKRSEYYMSVPETWSGKELEAELGKPADWERMFDPNEGKYLMQELVRFMKYGIIRFENVPQKLGEVQRFGELMGFMQYSHYGDTFHVHSKANVSNLSYTNKALNLHTDLPVLHNTPEVQLLHLIRQAGEGGASQFSDGLRVAEQIKRDDPEAYKMLCTIPIEYIDHGRDHYDYQLVTSFPIINLDKSGRPVIIYFSNHHRTWFFDCPAEQVPKMYDAIALFNQYCYKEDNLANFRLNSGEVVMFYNNRVLHGRSSFTVSSDESVERQIEGGYVTFDMIKSKIRVLQSKFTPDDIQLSV